MIEKVLCNGLSVAHSAFSDSNEFFSMTPFKVAMKIKTDNQTIINFIE